MTTITGKLQFVNLAAAGKTSDNIVVENAEGHKEKVYLKKGEGNKLTGFKGSILTIETKESNGYLWSSSDKITVTGGKPAAAMNKFEGDTDRNLSINYQSARKDAILALQHNLGKGQITPVMIHEFTLELVKLAMSKDLTKQVFGGKSEPTMEDDEFELNGTGY